MTPELEIGFLLGVLAVMAVLFLTEKLPVDLTAFGGLVLLVSMGFIKPGEAFTGFSSPAVITMLGVFFVSAALENTGVADTLARQVQAVVGSREVPLMIFIMVVAGGLSAFMNNIAATAVMLPAVASLARRAQIPPSRLFIPLAFGAILGGTTTLVGTPPNILTAQVLQERGLEPFKLFDFTPYGVALLLVGILYMVTVGRWILPRRESGMGMRERADLLSVYRIRERLFSIRIPAGSSLDGRTVSESRIGQTLGVQVLAIIRGGEERLAPEPHEVMRGGDLLLVDGSLENLRELLRVQGVEMEEERALDLSEPASRVGSALVRLQAGSELLGRSLRGLAFRERFGAAVAGIWREGELDRDRLALHRLREGDELLVLGPRAAVDEFTARRDLELLDSGSSAVRRLEQNLFFVRVPPGSPLASTTVKGSRIGELVGLLIVGVVRDGETMLTPSPDDPIREGDELVLAGEPGRILGLLQVGKLDLAERPAKSRLESRRIGMIEAVVAPRSSLAGKTMRELAFRDRYGLAAIAIWREAEPILGDLADVPLRIGDGLLLQGPWEKIRMLGPDPDFLALSEAAQRPVRTRKAPFAIGALLLMIGLVVTGTFPIQVAAFAAAVVAVLGGALTMQQAYRAVEWRAIFLVAAILPVGIAMERTGAALLIANSLTGAVGDLGPYVLLAALMVLASLFSQCLDGAPTVVLLAPVVVQIAEQMKVSPYPLMMGVGLAASAAFMTPFSHKANLLVMGAGGYRAMDYVRVGTPLTVVVLAILVFLIPVFIPF